MVSSAITKQYTMPQNDELNDGMTTNFDTRAHLFSGRCGCTCSKARNQLHAVDFNAGNVPTYRSLGSQFLPGCLSRPFSGGSDSLGNIYSLATMDPARFMVRNVPA